MNGTDIIQALLNITVNAFQASSVPHSVVIAASIHLEPLDLTTFKDGPQDRFLNIEHFQNAAPIIAAHVQDTGPGIPLELLPKIFQPYFTTKDPRHGTGLGLSIVQRLVKEAKGALHVHTNPGQGCNFTIYLPADTLPANLS
jgi:signal transduction histidine kinase